MLTVFAICIFLSGTVPLVALACAFYAAVRHIVDCTLLLTVYRKEIDSSGCLIESATNCALIFVLIYQLCMMAYLVLQEKDEEALTCTLIFVISIVYIVVSYESIYGLLIHDEANELDNIDLADRGSLKLVDDKKRTAMLQKWRMDYDHPLVVSSVRRRMNTVGLEIKKLDDWQQFVNDSSVKELLHMTDGNFPSRESGMFNMTKEIKGVGNKV